MKCEKDFKDFLPRLKHLHVIPIFFSDTPSSVSDTLSTIIFLYYILNRRNILTLSVINVMEIILLFSIMYIMLQRMTSTASRGQLCED